MNACLIRMIPKLVSIHQQTQQMMMMTILKVYTVTFLCMPLLSVHAHTKSGEGICTYNNIMEIIIIITFQVHTWKLRGGVQLLNVATLQPLSTCLKS